ncbi:MAG: UDP-N-acetylmuramoyl-tripeptide--D-alanyl-D-alanine ligase [Candidatus Marisimplicoccus sp.]
MDIQNLYSLFQSSDGVSIDSRSIKKDQIYFSIKGENYDGNSFALDAIDKGAKFSIVDNPELKNKNDKIIFVENSLKELQNLSKYNRSKSDVKVVGLTGSNGKTTTKNLIYSVVSQKYNTLCTYGNLNNHIGVPLTLLNIKADTEIAVIEMGANHVGEIENLCQICMPDIGLITNFGSAHLEGFGDLKGVIKGKTELYKYLIKNYGHILINNDDQIQKEECKTDLYSSFGNDNSSDFIFEYVKEDDRLVLLNNSYSYNCKIYGAYNFPNIASAISIGKILDLDSDQIQNGLNKFKTEENRSEVLQYEGNKIYLDAYNANPSSMIAAIDNFNKEIKDNKIVILGDMLELGNFSKDEHTKIIDHLCEMNLESVYLVGEIFCSINITDSRFKKFNDTKELINGLDLTKLNDKSILIKGSRSIGLEELIS